MKQSRKRRMFLLTGLFLGVGMLGNAGTSNAEIQTFEDGLLTGWVVGGRQISGSGNSWGVSEYAGSQMAYLHHISFTELTLTKTYAFSPGMVLESDAEFSINGDTSPRASGGSAFYSMDYYTLSLFDINEDLLGSRRYGAATSTYPYTNASVVEFRPDGLEHYGRDMSLLATELGIDASDVESFALTFGGYSSWWSSDSMIVRFDNVGFVPIPAAVLFMSALGGLIVLGRRRNSLKSI